MALDCTDACTILIDDVEAEKSNVIDAENLSQIYANTLIDDNIAEELASKINGIVVSNEIKSEGQISLLKSYDVKLSETVEILTRSWKLLIAAIESKDELKRLTNEISIKRILYQTVHSKAIAIGENYYATNSSVTEQLSDYATKSKSISTSSASDFMIKPES